MTPSPAALRAADGGSASFCASDPEVLWTELCVGLRRNLGNRTFDHWLKHVRINGYDAATGILSLNAPSAFTGEQISKRFADRILLAWRQHDPLIRELVITAAPRHATASALVPDRAAHVAEPLPASPVVVDARLRFDSFVVGPSNRLARNAAMQVAGAETPQFNPLYLRSETGQGKTHLLNAIAAATLARKADARIILMSAEKFMVEFVSAMRANDMMAFKARLRAADLLLVDDLQFVIGKDSTQLELLHTFDEVMTSGGRLVVAADRLPHRLDGIDQRLLSRLAGGLVADIDPPDRDLRCAILDQRVATLGVDVAPSVLDWIADHFPRNVRELEGALNKLVAYAALTDEPITVEQAEMRLAETVRGSRARITIEDIQRAVCAHYRLDRSEMASQRRARAVARPRQVAMYLAKELTPRSFPEIGRRFGGRDHSTVIHAVRTIETLRTSDADLDTDIRRIRRALTA